MDQASFVLSSTSIAALPPSVRKGYAFALMPFIFRGCASGDVEAQPQEFSNLIGKAEPFRTGRGKAAVRLRDPAEGNV